MSAVMARKTARAISANSSKSFTSVISCVSSAPVVCSFELLTRFGRCRLNSNIGVDDEGSKDRGYQADGSKWDPTANRGNHFDSKADTRMSSAARSDGSRCQPRLLMSLVIVRV
jgi:hypothetical protein